MPKEDDNNTAEEGTARRVEVAENRAPYTFYYSPRKKACVES